MAVNSAIAQLNHFKPKQLYLSCKKHGKKWVCAQGTIRFHSNSNFSWMQSNGEWRNEVNPTWSTNQKPRLQHRNFFPYVAFVLFLAGWGNGASFSHSYVIQSESERGKTTPTHTQYRLPIVREKSISRFNYESTCAPLHLNLFYRNSFTTSYNVNHFSKASGPVSSHSSLKTHNSSNRGSLATTQAPI